MSRTDDQRVADILDACDELAVIVAMGHEAFLQNPINRRAAERLLEIIGEAANQPSSELTAALPQIPWRDVAALWIRLAHHYNRIDPDQVWVIACEHVPVVRDALRSL